MGYNTFATDCSIWLTTATSFAHTISWLKAAPCLKGRRGPIVRENEWVPLYEAKMIHHYDHRWATYEPDGSTVRDMTDEEKLDPHREPLPRYWVPEEEVEKRLLDRGWDRQWLMGWRGVTNATNERTVIATVFPRMGVGNSAPLLVAQRAEPALLAALLANLSSLVLDFHARHKIGGSNLNLFILEQLAVLPPSAYDSESLVFIVPWYLSCYTPACP